MRDLISDYQALTKEINKAQEKIASIYYAAASAKIKNVTDMPMAPGFSNSSLDDVFIRIEELNESITEYRKARDRIAEQIEARLDLAGLSGTDRVVFWYREIHGKKWHEIAAKTDKSVRTLQRISQKPIYMSLLL